MANINRILMIVSRISAWILLILMIMFIMTGYSMVGMYGFNKVIGKGLSLNLHLLFGIPIVLVFIIHSGIQVYFAIKRWRWI